MNQPLNWSSRICNDSVPLSDWYLCWSRILTNHETDRLILLHIKLYKKETKCETDWEYIFVYEIHIQYRNVLIAMNKSNHQTKSRRNIDEHDAFMLHFRRERCPYRWPLRSAQSDFPLTSMCIWWRNVWNDDINTFPPQNRQTPGDDGNRRAKRCDKRDDTPNPISQRTSLWLIFCNNNNNSNWFH